MEKRKNSDEPNTRGARRRRRRGNELSTAIVWFRRDLRLEDNPALDAALRAHDRILCAYVHAPDDEAPWAPGAASRWWLHHSLAGLDDALRRRGAFLHIATGPTQATLERLIDGSGASAIYWNRLYEPALTQRDAAIKKALRARGVDAHSFNAALLIEPWDVATAQGGPYKVFTPYWRSARARIQARPPIAAPRSIPATATVGLRLDDLRLLPRIDWAGGMRAAWTPGEAGAQQRLRGFVDGALAGYAAGRDVPAADGTSRLSAHLHFGEIGPRQVFWQLAESHRQAGARLRAAAAAFERELGWREFSHHLLHHFPLTPQENFNRRFDAFPWRSTGDAALGHWRRGTTGVPIIDAGMRELWNTGWMHNRVRMLVASFLTKNLGMHWLHGARWFWDTLVDADLANNTQGWQWTAGSGADAAPYFRIFNPVAQGLRFDPAGEYVRHWLPELRDVAAPLVHEPWRDAAVAARTGYAAPLVDLAESRAAALELYRKLRNDG